MFLWVLAMSLAFQSSDFAQIETLIRDNPAEAEKALLKAVDVAETEARAALLLCHLYTNQNDYEKALPYGKKAVELLPEDSQANYLYAVAIRQKMSDSTMFAMANSGKYKKLLDKAIEADSNNLDAYEEKFGFLMNAPAIAGGSIEKADALAAEVKEKNRERGLIMQYNINQKRENHLQSFEIAKELIALNPEKMRYQFFYGFSLQALEKFTDASTFFVELYQKNPSEIGALYQTARSHILGEFDQEKAIAALDSYIEKANEKTQPSIAAAHWRAGMAYQQLGDKENAHKRYTESLRLDPDMEEAKKALKQLK